MSCKSSNNLTYCKSINQYIGKMIFGNEPTSALSAITDVESRRSSLQPNPEGEGCDRNWFCEEFSPTADFNISSSDRFTVAKCQLARLKTVISERTSFVAVKVPRYLNWQSTSTDLYGKVDANLPPIIYFLKPPKHQRRVEFGPSSRRH